MSARSLATEAADLRVILFAHGSRQPEWSKPFQDLHARVAAALGKERVRLAYLGFNSPGLVECAREAAEDGISRLYVIPLFFGEGRHVRIDLPGLVKAARRRCPTVHIDVAGSLSEDEGFRQALLDRVLELTADASESAREEVA